MYPLRCVHSDSFSVLSFYNIVTWFRSTMSHPDSRRRRPLPSTTNRLLDPFAYVDEDHMKAFEEALTAESIVDYATSGPSLPNSPTIPQSIGTTRIRKVSAMSDFAPVNIKVNRRKKRTGPPHKKQEWLYILLRWPLLLLIGLFIACEFGFYVAIRQVVNAKEWLSAWRGRKGQLRKQLRASRTYEEWVDAAEVLDDFLDFDGWKRSDEDPYYDWRLVRKVKKSLRTLRANNDVRGVLEILETCIRDSFAGVESPRLYSETYYGTKDLIESYIDELESALKYIRETPLLRNEEKKQFFRNANTNLGLTALCLSGGATFAYYHFGVVKAFLDANLLPRIITGTSAGALVAALTCTHTDDELREILVPELANKINACEESINVWATRFWKTGARFDSVDWARKACWFTFGSMTFREAYNKTGRVLNISVVPSDRHSPTKVLNYITAPDTVIWSAMLATAAVPGIMNPVVLMQKLKTGRLVPWNWGSKFKDGSLRVDIPLQSLHLLFNVTHPVVAQANPHVHLFFFAPRGSAGKPVAHRKNKGWRGNFLLSAAEQWLKLELTKNFKVIRDLDLLPELLGSDWSSVFLQRFDGAVTIWPRTRFMDWLRILTDPDPSEMARLLRVGQFVTWPKLHMIKNRMRLERQIYLGRQATKTTQPGPSFRVSNESLRPASAGLQSNMSRAVDTQAESDDDDFDTRTLDAPEGWAAPTQPADVRPPDNASFLSRLRTRSFPGLASPIRRQGRLFAREEPAGRQRETSGSSDGSSAEDGPQRQAYHPGALRNRPDVRRIFADREATLAAGSDDDEDSS
ncbi:patatin-domain-containing protein [Lactarius hengduanensis]|nr:patatin-domain-containing protein [Lactarius hengduanensis]